MKKSRVLGVRLGHGGDGRDRLLMWNPITSAKFLPGEIIPAAKATHGGEAVLAVLAIILWHFYGVHIKFFNKAMWTGKMTEEQMQHEHPLELAAIKAGSRPHARRDDHSQTPEDLLPDRRCTRPGHVRRHLWLYQH
ncbi:MAG: hypothetical protein IPJ46_02175 [Anaerolineales bacterium]|nr:hypothetical protein [Anaerolineales bacterium]